MRGRTATVYAKKTYEELCEVTLETEESFWIWIQKLEVAPNPRLEDRDMKNKLETRKYFFSFSHYSEL